MADLRLEILQKAPFFSAHEEALLNLLRTADCMQRALTRKIKGWGITSTQYNVLRILRGAQPRGLTCSAIGRRMITEDSDITRLLTRLKSLQLIRQKSDSRDHREVWTQVSEAGLDLLQRMDPEIQDMPEELLKNLKSAELAELVRLLELIRDSHGDLQPSVIRGEA